MLIPVTAADGVLLDLRYATADNFTGAAIYHRPVALLRPEAHAMLLAAAQRAARLGLRLKLFDAFRPVEAQWALWRALPDPRFVSDPAQGTGLHPRGAAVDVTLVDESGRELAMGTGFDDMTALSAQACTGLPSVAIRNRALLLGVMAAVGWQSIASEWWHYQVPDAAGWPSLGAAEMPNGPMDAASV